MIYHLGEQQSIVNQFVSEMRNIEIQSDRMRFRRNMVRLGEIIAYEMSKKLDYENREVTTPLGAVEVPILINQPILATILRAGLPFHEGFLNYFDQADSAFISAYRKHHKDGRFSVKVEYVSCPDLDGKTLIIVDPMLATGSSLVMSARALMEFGTPARVIVGTIIASKQGVEYVRQNLHGSNVDIWAAAIDEELTAQAYIVPGLGDAGDLAYGSKESE